MRKFGADARSVKFSHCRNAATTDPTLSDCESVAAGSGSEPEEPEPEMEYDADAEEYYRWMAEKDEENEGKGDTHIDDKGPLF
jgi:hypothetical protein